ncbi:MAG: hypothetical protein IJ533_08150 [Prevotella sp.]|nr:hypothetical protein [Prevotella sp.]
MKKIYMTPAVEALECLTEEMIAGSGVSSDVGIGYGGEDEGGKEDPASRIEELIGIQFPFE